MSVDLLLSIFFFVFQIDCPIRILHALNDEEIDMEKSRIFLDQVNTKNVDLIIRKQGNHRLMKPRDLTLLIYTLHKLLQDIDNLSKAQL